MSMIIEHRIEVCMMVVLIIVLQNSPAVSPHSSTTTAVCMLCGGIFFVIFFSCILGNVVAIHCPIMTKRSSIFCSFVFLLLTLHLPLSSFLFSFFFLRNRTVTWAMMVLSQRLETQHFLCWRSLIVSNMCSVDGLYGFPLTKFLHSEILRFSWCRNNMAG